MTWPNYEAAVELLREKLGYFDYEDPASEEAVVEWLPELIAAAIGENTTISDCHNGECDCVGCELARVEDTE